MLNVLVIAVIIVLLVVIFMIARMLVKKNLWLARRCVIGKDSPEKVEALKKLAKSFINGTFSMLADLNNAEAYELSIELKKQKHEIKRVRIKTEKTIVTCSSEYPEPFVHHNGFSELGATFFVFIGLLAILLYFAMFFLLFLFNISR